MVKCIEVYGYIDVNCYIFSDDITNHCYIIDPGAQAEKIIEYIEDNKLIPDYILLTHGHYDHIGCVDFLREKYDIDAFIFSNDYCTNSEMNVSVFFKPFVIKNCCIFKNNITLKNGSLNLDVLYTPGHTKDSVILYSREYNLAFTGDTIFFHGHGRYDLPGGNKGEIYKSITEIFNVLPEKTVLYPGHGESTRICGEKNYYQKIGGIS